MGDIFSPRNDYVHMASGILPRSEVDAKRMGGSQSLTDKINFKPSTSVAGKVLSAVETGSELSEGKAIPAPRVLLLDIETSPNLAYVWSMYKVDNISSSQLVEHGEMICFAVKWLDKDESYFYSVYHDGKETMVSALRDLLDLADIVVTYNGNKFDLPIVNTEMLMLDLDPPSPYKSLDLYLTIKSTFRFPISKLEYVLKHLGLKNKENSGGFETWKMCMLGDHDAWQQMMIYNLADIAVLQELYHKVRGWIPRHPSYSGYMQSHVCPNCGSDKLERRGFSHTQTSRYQRWQCKNCGKWSRSTHRESGTEITEAVS